MGIYDREYYRERTRGSGWISGTAPAVTAILLINLGVFGLEMFTDDPDQGLSRWLSANSEDIFHGQVWRLVTATFLHSHNGFMHIAMNMLALFFIGREMESFYGTREFWWLYLSAGAVSTLCWAVLDYPARMLGHSMIGASGAVLAVVTLYTIYNPRREMLLGFFFPVQMWLLLTVFIGWDALQLLSGTGGRVAVAAHLGGAAYAGVFWWLDLRLKHLKELWPRSRPRLRIVTPDPPRREAPAPRPSPSSSPTSAPTSGPSWATDQAGPAARSAPTAVVPQEQLEARLDEILAKIASEGPKSLTDDEKRILEEASRRARNRRSERI